VGHPVGKFPRVGIGIEVGVVEMVEWVEVDFVVSDCFEVAVGSMVVDFVGFGHIDC
jgi:hypothetical protein